MRNRFFRYVLSRNAVFTLGFGLPLLIFGSTSAVRAASIGVGVLIVVPVSHAISFFLEPFLRKPYRVTGLIVVAAAVLTTYELVLRTVTPEPGFRTLLVLRLLVTDCLLVWPFLRSTFGESFQHRLEHAIGLSFGFVVTLALFATLRYALNTAGWSLALSTAIGFFVIGYAKALGNAVRGRR